MRVLGIRKKILPTLFICQKPQFTEVLQVATAERVSGSPLLLTEQEKCREVFPYSSSWQKTSEGSAKGRRNVGEVQ